MSGRLDCRCLTVLVGIEDGRPVAMRELVSVELRRDPEPRRWFARPQPLPFPTACLLELV